MDYGLYAVIVVLVIIIIIMYQKKDHFTNAELKKVIEEASLSGLDYVQFVAKLGSADVTPLDYSRLLELHKQGKLNHSTINLVLSGRGMFLNV
jgi:hypothetical protein